MSSSYVPCCSYAPYHVATLKFVAEPGHSSPPWRKPMHLAYRKLRCQLVAFSLSGGLQEKTTRLYKLAARLQRALPASRAAPLRIGPCAVQASGRARVAAVQVLCREATTLLCFHNKVCACALMPRSVVAVVPQHRRQTQTVTAVQDSDAAEFVCVGLCSAL